MKTPCFFPGVVEGCRANSRHGSLLAPAELLLLVRISGAQLAGAKLLIDAHLDARLPKMLTQILKL